MGINSKELILVPSSKTSKTKLAQKLAPPEKYPVISGSIGLMILINIIGIVLAAASDNYIFMDYGFYVSLIVTFLSLIFGIKYNLKEWPKKVEEWEKLYFCFKCGHIFELKDKNISNNSDSNVTANNFILNN